MTRLGVVGYGGRIHGMVTGPFRQVDPDLRVVAVVDPDESRVRERLADCDDDVAFHESIDAMMRGTDLDAVAVGTRCNLHAGIATELAAYDRPLFLEKPVATTLDDAIALEHAFENSRCQVVVSFPLRVSPLCALARQYIESDAVGEPLHVHAVNYVPYGTVYWEEVYRDYAVTGGLFLQKATHDFDYLMYLMGQSITRVAATATRGRIFGGHKPAGLRCSACDETDTCPESPANRRRNGSGGSLSDHPCLFSVDSGSGSQLNEDCSSALLEFADGSHGVYSQVFYARRDAGARGATVSGYDGTVGFDWYTNELTRVRHHQPFSATERAGEGMSHFGGDMALAEDFLAVVNGTGTSRTRIEAGIQSVYACLAARASAEGAGFVDVRQVGAE
jgi:predicted dehydrogenase